jgi:hypothetical protein
MTEQQPISAVRLTWDGPDAHVKVATSGSMLWSKAWKTEVPGLYVVFDEAHDVWTLTHQQSGKAVLRLKSPLVDLMRDAARQLAGHDWTVGEEAITEEQRAGAEQVEAGLLQGLANKWGTVSV